jgi:hypothetical protein
MAFDVAIKITSEADLAALKLSEEATKKVREELQRTQVAASTIPPAMQPISPAVTQVSGAVAVAAGSLDKLGSGSRLVRPLVGAVANSLTEVGQGAGLLSSGISQLLIGGLNPVGLAITAVAVGSGIAIQKWQEWKKESEELTAQLKKFGEAQNAIAVLNQSIASRGRLAADSSAMSQLAERQASERRSLVQSFAQILTDEKLTGEQQAKIRADRNAALAKLDQVAAVERVNQRIRDAWALAQERQGIINQVAAVQFEAAMIGATAAQTIGLTTAQKLNALAADEQMQKHSALANQLASEIEVTGRLKAAMASIQTGQAGLQAAALQFGVKVPGLDTANQLRMGTQFFGLAQALDDQKAPFETKINAFASFARQALEQKIPDISGLLFKSGFDTRQVTALLDGLKRQFGEDFYNAVVRSSDGFRRYWENAETNISMADQAAGNFGNTITDLDNKIAALAVSVARQMSLAIDASQAKTAIQEVKTMLDGIPLVSYRQLILETKASGSPVMDFSTYFDSYMPSKIDKIGALSPEVIVNIPNLSERMAQLNDLGAQIQALQQNLRPDYGQIGSGIAYNNYLTNERIAALQQQASVLRGGLAQDTLRAQLQAQQSGGGAATSSAGGGSYGGGDVNITINIASVTQEVLDRQLLPKFEAAVKEATGKNPNYRVLN